MCRSAKLATGRCFAQPENAEISFKKSKSSTFCKVSLFATKLTFRFFGQKVKTSYFSQQVVLFDFSGNFAKSSLFDFLLFSQEILFANSFTFRLFGQFSQNVHFLTFRSLFAISFTFRKKESQFLTLGRFLHKVNCSTFRALFTQGFTFCKQLCSSTFRAMFAKSSLYDFPGTFHKELHFSQTNARFDFPALLRKKFTLRTKVCHTVKVMKRNDNFYFYVFSITAASTTLV